MANLGHSEDDFVVLSQVPGFFLYRLLLGEQLWPTDEKCCRLANWI